jgi:Holliday junction resolvasome RuvABC ATP-dependent DNA helicase subunit
MKSSVFNEYTWTKLLGIISVGFDIIDQLLIRYLHSSETGEKMGIQWIVHQLFTELKKSL